MSELAVGQSVRVLAPDNPHLHLRRGRIYKVIDYGGETHYDVQFDGDLRVFGHFLASFLVPCEANTRQEGENQEEYFAREYAPDMRCWAEEAMMAFHAFTKQQRPSKKKA